MAILNPLFSSPTRWSSGISTSGKVIDAVFEARWPILSSCLSTTTPASRGTTNAEMPSRRAAGSVFGVDRVPVGVAAVGDERLRAVDDVLVGSPDGVRAHPGHVRARI